MSNSPNSQVVKNEIVKMQPGLAPHILVLDDDHIYGTMLKKLAKKYEIPLTFICPNMDFETLPIDDYFDVIILDYDLGQINGCQLASLFQNTPVILASNKINVQELEKNWPISVVEFIHKRKGLKNILSRAVKIGKNELTM